MIQGQSVIDLIQKRTSVRTYENRPVEEEKLNQLKAFIAEANNPFGARVRFELLESTEQKIGTYGFIKGAKTFFGGCVKKGPMDMEGFGYAFEHIVLFATALELGTCWLGGTFKRSSIIEQLKPVGEYLPAVSPVGQASQKKSLTEKAVAAGAGARKRKRFGEIFFDGDAGVPLMLDEGPLKSCLEMVRIGPSASNKQPWRVIVKDGACHFYALVDKRYAGNTMYGFTMQRIDLGIAACHFELSARELGLSGGFVVEDSHLISDTLITDGWYYGFSWC
jgi:nitroreductase